MPSANDIRKQFIDFFKSKNHQIVPSAPIVIKNDPTLLFTNAGMNQFKDYFLGNKPAPYPRVADTQKCLRVSGKHNDLEEVGVDTYHHTMFEMLGNWSFGDYFKKEAIEWSWELLTEIYKIPKDQLYVSVFKGDEKDGLPMDQEAFDIWKTLIDEDRIILGNKKDNFWEMGETGPCGPCSEIHVDTRIFEDRQKIDGKTLVNADHPEVIEIWNNVFMQFNRLKDGSLQNLPSRHVDTGMGLERLVRVLQGHQSNYDTDLFTNTIAATEKITQKKYNPNATPNDALEWKEAVAFRVIADHIRAVAFTIADGQLPSSNGAGYVVRRILRRAIRYYYSNLNYSQPLLYSLIHQLALQFKDVFPELKEQQAFVERVIKEEEEAFLRTLEKGLRRLEEALCQVKNNILDGAIAFEMYDTYGFPIDLTRLIAQENNVQVDEAGFEKGMVEQVKRSRAASTVDTDDWQVLIDEEGTFSGYSDLNITTRVLKYRKVKLKSKELFQIVLKDTPFYAESGGQVGDVGRLVFGDENITVLDTKKENDLILHFVAQLPTDISTRVTAVVDVEKRFYTAYNHTATHLMHAALRKILGPHVQQKGSLVNANYLRFDFSHFGKMTDQEIRAIEILVNEKIRENITVEIQTLPKEEALKLGAMALFGEKYGEQVRVVTMDKNYSVELCGGTHVPHTGMIGLFKIISEAAVASGVRRIEALTGPAAIQYFIEQFSQMKSITEVLKTKDPIKTIEKLMEEKSGLEKKIERYEAKAQMDISKALSAEVESINGVNFVGAVLEVNGADALRKIAFELNKKHGNLMVVLAANINGKAQVGILLDKNLVETKQWSATQIIKEKVAPFIKGGGGGQPTYANAGGQDVSNLDQVIQAVKSML